GEVLVPVADVADLHLVQLARGLLAVAGDEGDGVLLLQQLDGRPHLRGTQPQPARDGLRVPAHAPTSSSGLRAQRTPMRAPTTAAAACSASIQATVCGGSSAHAVCPVASPKRRLTASQTTTEKSPI